MKKALIVAFCSFFVYSHAQERFVTIDYSQYYEWFHEHSQVEELYANGSTLFTFSENTRVFADPCNTSAVITALAIGTAVRNIAYDEYFLPEDQINGYGDIWYHVEISSPTRKKVKGYIWGADIAKGWQGADLTGDQVDELVLLGVSSLPRVKPTDIFAELRVVQNGKMFTQKVLPGLCIFEDCGSSPLLRIFAARGLNGKLVIEASTMTIGCDAGIERAFLYWDGRAVQRVFHGEYTTNREFARKAFEIRNAADDTYQICEYSHQDDRFEPVWNCRVIQDSRPKQATAPDRDVAKAR